MVLYFTVHFVIAMCLSSDYSNRHFYVVKSEKKKKLTSKSYMSDSFSDTPPLFDLAQDLSPG